MKKNEEEIFELFRPNENVFTNLRLPHKHTYIHITRYKLCSPSHFCMNNIFLTNNI